MQHLMWADLEIAARTVWGEARGESQQGREAVAWVLRNRVEATTGQFREDVSPADAALKPWHFSVWNAGDPNRLKMQALALADPVLLACLAAVATAWAADRSADPTGGARHYHAAGITPAWAEGRRPSARIGRHLFYADVP